MLLLNRQSKLEKDIFYPNWNSTLTLSPWLDGPGQFRITDYEILKYKTEIFEGK